MPAGIQKFWPSGYTSDLHDEYLSDHYFTFVGACSRFPRYKNKRCTDPQVKLFLDAEGVEIPGDWGIPTPNPDAAFKSLGKYGKPTVNMSDKDVILLNKAFSMMVDHFYPYMGESDVLSLEESISRLDLSTTCGAPFNTVYKTKRDLMLDDDIRLWLEEDWERLAEDPLYTMIFSSSLKEELRTALKIEQNSIRTFCAGAADATIQGNRLFVDQNERMYNSHLKSASVIGMSPLKGNWDMLYRKLNVFKNGYALDESQYDSSLREFLMWGCAKFRYMCLASKWQTPAMLRRVKTYYRNLINTLILTAEGILVMKKLGNPSGSVNTVTDNTLILYWIMSFAWLKTVPESMASLACFEDSTAKALLGDDNTWTVSDVAHEFYNGPSVINAWKLLGITTTTDCLEPRPARDLDFLSAFTIFHKGRAVPLYSRNKLMQSLMFATKEHLSPITTLTRACCLMQIGWTDIAFRRYVRELVDFLMVRYDRILLNDSDWIIAKSNIKPDAFYSQLVHGETLIYPQGFYQEHGERLIKPDNTNIIAMSHKTIAQKQQKRKDVSRGIQRTQGPKKGTSTGRKAVTTTRVRNTELGVIYNAPDCALHYMGTVVDPFDSQVGACVPADLFPLPSMKTKTFKRLTMVVGTNGIGYATACPVGINDGAVIQVTTATSVGASTTIFSAFTNLLTGNLTQNPYNTAQFGSGNVQYRLVGCGLRIKYIGRMLDRNGVCLAYEDPDHLDVRARSYDAINGSVASDIVRVGDARWDQSVCYSGPVTPSEVEFVTGGYYCPGDCPMVIAVSGIAGDQYEVEYYQHTEFIGSVVSGKTKSHADGPAFGKSLEAIKGLAATKPIEPSMLGSVWSSFKNAMSKSLPSIVETIGGAAMLAARQPRGLAMIAHGGGSIIAKMLGGGVPAHSQQQTLRITNGGPIVQEIQ